RLEDLARSPRDWQERTERFRAEARREVEWFRGRDAGGGPEGYRATFDGPARAIRSALALTTGAVRFGVGVRVGLHTGECLLAGGRPAGLAVDISDAVARRAPVGSVFVSRTVRDLVAGSGLRF